VQHLLEEAQGWYSIPHLRRGGCCLASERAQWDHGQGKAHEDWPVLFELA
jgi:hypothetical protein